MYAKNVTIRAQAISKQCCSSTNYVFHGEVWLHPVVVCRCVYFEQHSGGIFVYYYYMWMIC